MAKRDYYKVLDVPRTATEADIKKAYRRLAMKFHPDRNPGDKEAEENFKEAKEAYEVLCEADKRAVYDQHGHAGIDAQRNSGGRGGAGADAFGEMFGEMFGDIFGGGRRGAGGRQVFRGADLKYELELDLNQAVFGHSSEIDVARLMECDTCGGSGAAKGHKPTTCETCNGAGQVRISQGFFQLQQPCPHCRGTGSIIKNPCDTCLGQGRIRRSKRLAVKIPAGVDTGDRIRLSGEGEAGRNGGPPGDLYVEIHVREHEIFERDGADLLCRVPISFATAVLGGNVEVATLDGSVSLKIPAETQSGTQFRLRDKGVKSVRSRAPGDLYCKVAVETPVNLTVEQRELLEKFEATFVGEGARKHSPKSSTFLDGVKGFWDRMVS